MNAPLAGGETPPPPTLVSGGSNGCVRGGSRRSVKRGKGAGDVEAGVVSIVLCRFCASPWLLLASSVYSEWRGEGASRALRAVLCLRSLWFSKRKNSRDFFSERFGLRGGL